MHQPLLQLPLICKLLPYHFCLPENTFVYLKTFCLPENTFVTCGWRRGSDWHAICSLEALGVMFHGLEQLLAVGIGLKGEEQMTG